MRGIPILAKAPYYGDNVNVALHTDICSPLATDPTWSKLPSKAAKRLESEGKKLWYRLVAYLAPDIIIVSVATKHLQKITQQPLAAWDTIYTIDRNNPYSVRLIETTLAEGKKTYIVFGTAAQKPFGKVSDVDKETIGKAIRQRIWAI